MSSVPPAQPPAAPEGEVPCPECGGSMRFCEHMDDPFAPAGRDCQTCGCGVGGDDKCPCGCTETDASALSDDECGRLVRISIADDRVFGGPGVDPLLVEVERIVAERVRVVEGERECVCPTDDYCPKCHPRWYAKWVKGEIENLRRWKEEALPVIAGLQDLGSALGLPLGERITGPVAVEAARTLTARAESAEAAHAALRAGVEALADAAEARERASLSRTFDGGTFGAWVSANALRALAGGAERRERERCAPSHDGHPCGICDGGDS